MKRGFDHVLGFGAGDEDVWGDAEIATVEFLTFGDVLGGLAAEPFVQVAAVVEPLDLTELLFGMRVEVLARYAHGVAEEDFGGQSRDRDIGILQELGPLEECRLDGHKTTGKLRSPGKLKPPHL